MVVYKHTEFLEKLINEDDFCYDLAQGNEGIAYVEVRHLPDRELFAPGKIGKMDIAFVPESGSRGEDRLYMILGSNLRTGRVRHLRLEEVEKQQNHYAARMKQFERSLGLRESQGQRFLGVAPAQILYSAFPLADEQRIASRAFNTTDDRFEQRVHETYESLVDYLQSISTETFQEEYGIRKMS